MKSKNEPKDTLDRFELLVERRVDRDSKFESDLYDSYRERILPALQKLEEPFAISLSESKARSLLTFIEAFYDVPDDIQQWVEVEIEMPTSEDRMQILEIKHQLERLLLPPC